MLKSQDIVLLLKLLSRPSEYSKWSQNKLAVHLCISVSEINASIKRLKQAGLLRQIKPNLKTKVQSVRVLYMPVNKACEEFLISGVKYFFPAKLGEYTRGMITSYAADVFENQIALGEDPVPVWPFAQGDRRGLALVPLYSSVPKSLFQYPDQDFYDLLSLVDIIRQGRARERVIAIKILKQRISNQCL